MQRCKVVVPQAGDVNGDQAGCDQHRDRSQPTAREQQAAEAASSPPDTVLRAALFDDSASEIRQPA
jgi:hypothetical protein